MFKNEISSSFKKIISTSGINFGYRIFGLLTSFLTSILIARLFGVATFGNYSLVFALSQTFALFFTLGIPNTLIKIIGNENYTYNQSKKLLIKSLKVVLLFSVIPVLFFYFASNFISNNIFHNPELINYLYVVSFSIPFFIVHEIFLFFLIATKRFMKYNIFMFVIPNILLILFLIIFYNLKISHHFTFVAFSISILITLIFEILTIFELKPQKNHIPITTKKLIETASPLLFSGMFLYLLNYSNVIILGFLTNETQVGIYNIVYKLGSIGFLIIVSVSTIITPKIAELFGKGNLLELKSLIQNSTKLIAILTLPIVFFLIFFNKFILSFWGQEVLTGSTALIIISTGVLFSAILGNADQILNMTNNQKILRNITIVCFFMNFALSFLLIPKFGIEGAAISSLVTNVMLNVLCVYYIKKKLGFYTLF